MYMQQASVDEFEVTACMPTTLVSEQFHSDLNMGKATAQNTQLA